MTTLRSFTFNAIDLSWGKTARRVTDQFTITAPNEAEATRQATTMACERAGGIYRGVEFVGEAHVERNPG